MFGNPFDLRDDLITDNKPVPDPFGRLGVDDEPDTEIAEIKTPTTLKAPVGDSGQNRRRDVAKTEQLLGAAGTLDLKKTDGPTGYWGTRTSDATKAFQKQNGLKVDGEINPGGETIRALGQRVYNESPLETLKRDEQKTLILIENHEMNLSDIRQRIDRYQEQLVRHQEDFRKAESEWHHAIASAPASVAKDISAGLRTGPIGALVGAVSAGASLKNARDKFDAAKGNLNGTRTSLEKLKYQLEEQYTTIENLRGQLRQSK